MSRSTSDKSEIPVSTGEKVELSISRLNSDGDGVGSINGFTVFVPGALPGEKVLARIVRIHKNYSEAFLCSLLVKSGSRVDAPCPHFGTCGGCQLMHLDYREQLRYKRQKVVDALERIGKFKVMHPEIGQDSPGAQDHLVVVHPTLPSPSTVRYRNKVQVLATNGSGGAVGMCRTGSNEVIEIADCNLAPEGAFEIINRLKVLLSEAGIPLKEWPKVGRDGKEAAAGKGVGNPSVASKSYGALDDHHGMPSIRHILVRTSSSSQGVMVIIVTDPGQVALDNVTHRLTKDFPVIESVIRNINAHPTSDVSLGSRNIILYGSPYIIEELDGIKFKIAPNAFFQVNTEQTAQLYRKIIEYAAPQSNDVVLDLFCGVGSISLFLARKAGRVIGVEVVKEAIDSAVDNAELNGMRNMEFHAGQVEKVLPSLLRQGIKPDIIVLDPPRKGCEKSALEALAAIKSKRIIYVSCDPASLARDLRVLTSFGYRVNEVQPVDMFPMTSHTESVCLLERA